jgi:glycosyltransferase involved in cell wall biosynthesis
MRTHPGIGRYIRELTQALPVYGPDFSFDLLERAHAPIYGLREQWEIPALAKRADLLHVPHFNFPLNWKKPLVVTIHDLIYLSYPSAAKSNLAPLYLRFMLNQLAKRDAKIVAVSEFTKRELLRIFPGFKAKNITVTYEAVSDYFRILDKDDKTLPDIAGKFALKTPFVLFVGSLKPHKNIPALIRALAAIKALKKLPHELILAGRVDGANTELRQLLTEHSFVRCIGNTSDEELRAIVAAARTKPAEKPKGPQFLDHLIRKLAGGQNDVELITCAAYLDRHPVRQLQKPNPSTWGSEGYNLVWLNGGNSWLYRHQHWAEEKIRQLQSRFPGATGNLKRALDQMLRELLLLQSSDWAFIMTTGTTVSYATKRFREHLDRFAVLADQVENNRIDLKYLSEIEGKDYIFEAVS